LMWRATQPDLEGNWIEIGGEGITHGQSPRQIRGTKEGARAADARRGKPGRAGRTARESDRSGERPAGLKLAKGEGFQVARARSAAVCEIKARVVRFGSG